jgi:hypothetical protein
MKLTISLPEIEHVKDALRSALPDVKSSHRVEAMARGLGWQTYAALRAALAAASVEVGADEDAFVAYLREHSFDAPRGCLTRALAKAGIRRAMDMEPTLTHFGYGVFRDRNKTREQREAEFAENRAAMLDDPVADEFVRAADFLSRFGRRQTINTKRGSYGLKHDAENLAGMLIAAALALGFMAKPTHPDSPNAFFNISSKARTAEVA